MIINRKGLDLRFMQHKQFTSYDFVKRILRTDPILYLTKKFSESEMRNILRTVVFTISTRPLVVDLDAASAHLPSNPVGFIESVYFTHSIQKEISWKRE